MRRLREIVSGLPVQAGKRIVALVEQKPRKAACYVAGGVLAFIVGVVLFFVWVGATNEDGTRTDSPVAEPEPGRMPDATPTPSLPPTPTPPQPTGLPVESAMPTAPPATVDSTAAPVASWWAEQRGECVVEGRLGPEWDGPRPEYRVGGCAHFVDVEFSHTTGIEAIKRQGVSLGSDTEITESDYNVTLDGERFLLVQVSSEDDGPDEWWVCDRDSVIAGFSGEKSSFATW